MDDADPVPARGELHAGELTLTYGTRTSCYAYARDAGAARDATAWLGRDGHTSAVNEEQPLALRDDRTPGADGTVRSPMPGTVLAVQVTGGERVTSGQPLLIVEAMKMEHPSSRPWTARSPS